MIRSVPAEPAFPRFKDLIAAKAPLVTCEIGTGDAADAEALRRRARLVAEHVDAVNVPDNTAGVAHMSAIAAGAILAQEGIEAIVHVTCRDRNRLALQSDLIGAAALGVRTVLCLTGDHMVHGDHPQAKPVFDLDSLQLVGLVNHLATTGTYLSGRRIEPPPDLLPGAVENPFAPPYEFRPLRLSKKVRAGARFVQTQITYNVARFAAFMERAREIGVDREAPILAGVAPLRSARAARHMRDHVPGMEIPEALIRRMDAAGDDKARREEEGIRICVEIIEQIREIKGVAGFHLMPIHWEEAVGEICRRARLQPARAVLTSRGATLDTAVLRGAADGPAHRIRT